VSHELLETPRSRWWAGARRVGIDQTKMPLLVAAVASWVAAAIHGALTPVHMRWWIPAGVFFLVCTAAQVLVCAALLGSPRPITLLGAIAANTAVIAVYIVSRTAGIPGAPGIPAHGSRAGPGVPLVPGAAERVHSGDLVALVAEVVLVVICTLCLPERWKNRSTDALVVLSTAVLGLWAAGVLR